MTADVEDLRLGFEAWVMSTEHKPYGWLGREWLDRHEESYADDYVHGLWVAYSKCMTMSPKTVNVAYEWIEFDRHDPQKQPKLGVEVLVRYARGIQQPVVIGATLDTMFVGDPESFLCWYNGRGETMTGTVTHWMPMIEVSE